MVPSLLTGIIKGDDEENIEPSNSLCLFAECCTLLSLQNEKPPVEASTHGKANQHRGSLADVDFICL